MHLGLESVFIYMHSTHILQDCYSLMDVSKRIQAIKIQLGTDNQKKKKEWHKMFFSCVTSMSNDEKQIQD